MQKIFTLSLALTCLLLASTLTAQYYLIPLEQKISESSTVIEGEVVSTHSFWNPQRTMIFTENTIRVYKVFKGKQVPEYVHVQTVGGSVGDEYVEASHLLNLHEGQTGIFFCQEPFNKLRSPVDGSLLLDVFSSEQGFLRYHLNENKATCPFVEVNDIEGKLYTQLEAAIGEPLRNVKPSFRAVPPSPVIIRNSANVSGFSPASVWAGAHNDAAKNTLTIFGTGFGVPESGKQVVFRSGNSATNTNPSVVVAATSNLVSSWADNQIVVKVPTAAGTGNFCVVLAPGDTALAPSQLQVFASILSATFTDGRVLQSNLMDKNGQGGYTIVYSTSTLGSGVDFTADSAYDGFRRAVNTWRNVAGIPVVDGGTTAMQNVSAGDGTNVIMYDNENTGVAKQSGTLGVCYSSNSACFGSDKARKTGFDIVLNNPNYSNPVNQPWNKSYCNPVINSYDLESVSLHELGHAFNLGHIIHPQEQSSGFTTRNPNALMHPSATLSVGRKTPEVWALEAAIYARTKRNFTDYGTCNVDGEVTPLSSGVPANDNCPLTFPAAPNTAGETIFIDLEKATANKLVDPQFRAIGTVGNANGAGVVVSNNVFHAIRTAQAGNLSLAVTNYTTIPAEAPNCPNTGFRIAVYQVNSCPQGQNWPAPVYTATPTGNGIINFEGLSGQTNYVLFFEGVSNTKSTFNVTIGNTALPIKISAFTGKVFTKYNELNLTMDLLEDISALEVERSADGYAFERVGSFKADGSLKQSFFDHTPLDGKNFYRVMITHKDGVQEYSKTLLLNRDGNSGIRLAPNPVENLLRVQIPLHAEKAYTIQVVDIMGRVLASQKSKGGLVTIPFAQFSRGVYHVRIENEDGTIRFIEKVLK